MFKKILIGLAIALLVIQFFQIDQDNKEVNNPQKYIPLNDEVTSILIKACNDCHSNNTEYPWYSNIQPGGWILANHISEGKGEVNFSIFESYPIDKKRHKLEECIEMIEEGEMPMFGYVLFHAEADLSDQEKEVLIKEFKSKLNSLK